MTPPDVSVVIATRDRWPWLQRTLAAVAGQHVDALRVQVVIADALSADGSWEALERLASEDPFPFRLTVVQAPAFGGAAARNAALAVATGQLVVLLADDARPAGPTLIADHVKAHRDRSGARAISGGLAWADADHPLAARLERSGAVGDDRGWLGGPPPLRIENCSMTRAALLAVDGFDERLTGWNVEGVELAWRLRDSGVALERNDDLLALRTVAPDPARWLAEVEDVGRNVDLLDRLHPGIRTPGPRGPAAVVARAGHPLARGLPGLAVTRRCALARGRGRAALPAVPERRGGIRPVAPSPTRPGVSVVVPFHGDREDLRNLLDALSRLRTGPQDEVIVADNTPGRISASASADARVRFVHAYAEQSAPHARNAGAGAARSEWLLFMDADCRPAPGLLDAYFAPFPRDDAGAVAGAVLDPVAQPGLNARYSASRERLGQTALLAHPYMPAAVTANLLVRRRTWEELGGLCEGIRSEEDLDFCWRMQRAGWMLEERPGAAVEHRHRETLRGLLAQAERFGRGFAWQDRRYPGSRITGHLLRRLPRLAGTAAWGLMTLRCERASFALLDVAVAAAEVSGRLRGGVAVPSLPRAGAAADMVFVVDTYGDVWNAPLVRDARALLGSGTAVRVEALRRGHWLDREAAHGLAVSFGEDDGSISRLVAPAALVLRHPVRCLAFRSGLRGLAPAARRVQRSGARHLHATGGGSAPATAAALARLTGLPFSVHIDGAGELAGQEEKLSRAAFVTSPSSHGAAEVRAALGPAEGAPEVNVVAHAIPPPTAPAPRAGPEHVVVVVGRLDHCAGLQEVAAAVAVLRARGRPARLLVLGEGPCRRAVAGSVEAPGIRQPADVLAELARADVLVVPRVLPEVVDWPPAAVFEALTAGCAVVGPVSPALADLVADKAGRLVDDSGAAHLATAIDALLDRSDADREAARALVSKITDSGHVAGQLAALIEAAARASR